MKISIITVAFNSAATIGQTLDSVQRQDYADVEHIIIDGKSTDATLDIVAGYPSVSRVLSEPDGGIYDAMNKGVALATGDVVGILNSDDIYADDHILSTIAEAFENQAIDAVYGNISYFRTGEEGRIVRFWRSKPYYARAFENNDVPPHPSLFVRKKVYDDIGGFRTDFKICADNEFMFRMLKLSGYKSLFLDKTIVKMRLGGASTSGLKSYWISTLEFKRVFEIHGLRQPFRMYWIRPLRKITQLFTNLTKGRFINVKMLISKNRLYRKK